MIPGANCIGRIHDVGPDATILKPGQLVLCDITVKARDDPDVSILMGLHGGAAPKLMEGEWRDGSFAEYAKFPLENVFLLDEEVMFGKLGYEVEDLCAIPGKPARPPSQLWLELMIYGRRFSSPVRWTVRNRR